MDEISSGGISGPSLPLGMTTPTHGRKRKPAWKAAGDAFGRATLVGDTGLKQMKKRK